MGTRTASRVLKWPGRARYGSLRVERTDSLGAPVVIVSDGVESLVLRPDQLGALVRMLREAQERARFVPAGGVA